MRNNRIFFIFPTFLALLAVVFWLMQVITEFEPAPALVAPVGAQDWNPTSTPTPEPTATPTPQGWSPNPTPSWQGDIYASFGGQVINISGTTWDLPYVETGGFFAKQYVNPWVLYTETVSDEDTYLPTSQRSSDTAWDDNGTLSDAWVSAPGSYSIYSTAKDGNQKLAFGGPDRINSDDGELDGKSVQFNFYKVTISPALEYLAVGSTKSLSAIVTPDVAGSFLWSTPSDSGARFVVGGQELTTASGQSVTLKGIEANQTTNTASVSVRFTDTNATNVTVWDHFTVWDLSIQKPIGDIDLADRSDYNFADVLIQGTLVPNVRPLSEISINWDFELTYTPTGGANTFSGTGSATNISGDITTWTVTAKGGFTTSTGSCTFDGEALERKTTFTVTGIPISNDILFPRLRNLYDGATTGLLKGICYRESSYAQFKPNITLYGHTDRWPTENYANQYVSAGEYIGLMQVPVAMNTAWDWLVNTQTGADVFAEKIQQAKNYENSQQASRPSLPDFAGIELENEALVHYGGFPPHYYAPNGSTTATAWIVNPSLTTTSLAAMNTYINEIRSHSD